MLYNTIVSTHLQLEDDALAPRVLEGDVAVERGGHEAQLDTAAHLPGGCVMIAKELIYPPVTLVCQNNS